MAEEKKAEESEQEDPSVYDTIEKPIVHDFPEDLTVTFSDNIAVQHTPSEFTITFAQIHHPLIGKSSDYDEIDSIRAKVVARIVLTPAKMLEFIQSLQTNWSIYQKRMSALKARIEESKKDAGTANSTEDSPSAN